VDEFESFGSVRPRSEKASFFAMVNTSKSLSDAAFNNLRLQIATSSLTINDVTKWMIVGLSNTNFCVGSVNLAQGFADFADSGVGADGIDDVGHGVSVGDISVGTGRGSLGGGSL
jgi:hypothetical protein